MGMHLLRYLAARGNYNLTVVDNFFRENKDKEWEELSNQIQFKMIRGDCTSSDTFAQLDSDYDYVYLLASVVGVGYTEEMPEEIIRINTSIILNTLEWMKAGNNGKLLFTSSSETYAGTVEAFDYKVPTEETVPLTIVDITHPRYTYAVTKMLGEAGVVSYARAYDFKYTILRYHNVYGKRMGFKHVIPQVTQRFFDGENPFKIIGADQSRSFCYINDAIEGTVNAMEKEKADGEIIHIGMQDEEIRIEELVKYIGGIMQFEGDYEVAKAPEGSVSRRSPDISKARELIGYNPVTGYKKGVESTVRWYINYFEEALKTSEH